MTEFELLDVPFQSTELRLVEIIAFVVATRWFALQGASDAIAARKAALEKFIKPQRKSWRSCIIRESCSSPEIDGVFSPRCFLLDFVVKKRSLVPCLLLSVEEQRCIQS